MSNTSPFIFHDVQESQMFALAQAAGRAGFDVHATVRPMTSWAEKSIYLKQCIEIPVISEVGEGHYAASLKKHQIQGVFLTCLDDVANFLARHETLLKRNGLKFITANEHTMSLATDLFRMPENGSLKVANTQLFSTEDLLNQAEELDYPIIIKSARFQFCTFKSAQELQQFFTKHTLATYTHQAYRIQKYIPGGIEKMATAMLLFDEQGRCVRGFTGRRQHVTSTHFGPFGETTAAKAEWIPELYEGARDLLTHIGWKGFAEVECKQGDNGQWYIMEINPRLSGWACLAEADGAGFLQAYYVLCHGEHLQEACLQRSQTTYIRVSSTVSDATDWYRISGRWQKTKAIISIFRRYYQQRPHLCLGAWDDRDFKASVAIFWASLRNLWKA